MYKTQLAEFCHGFLREMCDKPHVIFHFANDESYFEKAIDFFYEVSDIGGQVREINVANIKTEMFRHDNRLYIIFRFDNAKETPDPYYALVYIDLEIDDNFIYNLDNAKCRYFLSEIPQDNVGAYYCEWLINSDGGHVNYGHFNSADENDFVKFVFSFIAGGGKSVRVYHDESVVNSKIFNPLSGEVYIVGLVHLQLPGPYTWLGVDYIDNENIGAVYSLEINKDGDRRVGVSLYVVEEISDSNENDFIYEKHNEDVAEIDDHVHKTTRKLLSKLGHEMLWWEPSAKDIDNNAVHNRFGSAKKSGGNVINYIHNMMRMSYKSRRIVIIAMYDNEFAAEYGDVVNKIMSSLRVIDITDYVPAGKESIKH